MERYKADDIPGSIAVIERDRAEVRADERRRIAAWVTETGGLFGPRTRAVWEGIAQDIRDGGGTGDRYNVGGIGDEYAKAADSRAQGG